VVLFLFAFFAPWDLDGDVLFRYFLPPFCFSLPFCFLVCLFIFCCGVPVCAYARSGGLGLFLFLSVCLSVCLLGAFCFCSVFLLINDSAVAL